jgi:clan AA aspartic protease (TIGR02281 family)
MPRTYTVEIEVRRFSEFRPVRKSMFSPWEVSAWGYVLLFLFLFGLGVVGLAVITQHAEHQSTAQEFNNPFDDNSYGKAPDDDPLPDNEPVIKEAAQRLVIPGNRVHQCYVEGSATAKKTAPFRYLIDTGAWSVAFSREDARALGFDPAKLVFDQQTETANGTGKAANIRLRELRIGAFTLKDVPAQVNYNGMGSPLLGASALKEFLRLEYAQGNCIITLPNADKLRLSEAQRSMRDMNRLIENSR